MSSTNRGRDTLDIIKFVASQAGRPAFVIDDEGARRCVLRGEAHEVLDVDPYEQDIGIGYLPGTHETAVGIGWPSGRRW
jgi:hypothetical protein